MRQIISFLILFLSGLILISCSNSSQNKALNLNIDSQDEKVDLSPNRDLTIQKTPDSSEWKTPGEQGTKKTLIAKIPQKKEVIAYNSVQNENTGPILNPVQAKQLINDYRVQMGRRPLNLDPKLSQAAKNHAYDLSLQDKVSHIGSNGTNPWDRASSVGYNVDFAAENIGTGQTTFSDLLKKWQQNPKHKKNLLLDEATDMGIALVHRPSSQHKIFWTLVVARSK